MIVTTDPMSDEELMNKLNNQHTNYDKVIYIYVFITLLTENRICFLFTDTFLFTVEKINLLLSNKPLLELIITSDMIH